MPPDYIYGDWALAVVATIAAFATAWRMTDGWGAATPGRWLTMIGWMMLSARLWWLLLTVGDAPIHPVAMVALALIGLGTGCLQFRWPQRDRPIFRVRE
jgi:apolipoprotein N-acyltransferase